MSGVSEDLHAGRSGAELDVEHRLSLASQQDTIRGMHFRSVKEAMFVLRGSAAVEECLSECGGVRTFVDLFSYPAGDFLRMSRRAAWMMEPAAGGFEQAMRMLGYMGTAVFLGSQVGKAMQVLISGTPRRVIEYLPMAYKVVMPAGSGISVAISDHNRALVTFERDFLPRQYVEGALEAHLKQAGARTARIIARPRGPLSSVVELTWEL
ncbi:TIGR02265 family protein [Archangium lansingense]|uniref:TIGR02265 family protein n=1 Tax=Archangium lansingense TaxID=2995310 RepID=A0ABT4ANQ4_9BACT|nr:TIGR02265 family protein [Archangium lansinium]MCY1083328.1 TIGR02265 family protein [Archangium lansinium]